MFQLAAGGVMLGVLTMGTAGADIYKYVDENGVMHFTNAPTSSRYKVYIRSRSRSASPRPDTYTSDSFDHHIALAAKTHRIPFDLVKSIIKVESNFNSSAVSHKGAQGLMQLMPGTAKLVNVWDPFDPRQNIMGGTRYFRMLLDRFNGKVKLALAGYNAGPERVESYKGIPPFKETQNYVEKVIQYYYHLKKRRNTQKQSAANPSEDAADGRKAG